MIPLLVAVGGALGAAARYGIQVAWSVPTWPTLAINALGCLLIGILMARTANALLRALLGTGVLGGFTTFSTYTVDTYSLIHDGQPGGAAAYLTGTVAVCLSAAWLGTRLAGGAQSRPHHREPGHGSHRPATGSRP